MRNCCDRMPIPTALTPAWCVSPMQLSLGGFWALPTMPSTGARGRSLWLRNSHILTAAPWLWCGPRGSASSAAKCPAPKEMAQAAIRLCSEHGYPLWRAMGTILHGWALSESGQKPEGVHRANAAGAGRSPGDQALDSGSHVSSL